MRLKSRALGTTAQDGMTIIEQMVGITVTAILLAIGLPNYSEYIQNRHIRTAAESISDGLQLARIEAVRRNELVDFRGSAGAGGAWAVVVQGSGEAVQSRGATETTKASVDIVAAAVSLPNITVTFNGLGRVASGNAGSIFNVNHDSGVAGCGPTGSFRCMRVQMNAGGSVRLCDPQLAGGTPQACG